MFLSLLVWACFEYFTTWMKRNERKTCNKFPASIKKLFIFSLGRELKSKNLKPIKLVERKEN